MSKRIKIRLATEKDKDGLLKLTRQSPMQGVIGVRIDREPDFFALTKLRGVSKVWVAEKEGEIIGVFSCSRKKVWLNGKIKDVHYLADLKVLPQLQGTRIALQIVQILHDYLLQVKANLLYCTLAKGNNRVAPFFEGRVGIPGFRMLGQFSVWQILPRSKPGKLIVEIQDNTLNLGELSRFYNQYYKSYQLAPFVQEQNLEKSEHLFALKNGKVVAALSLFDSLPYKQNVVVHLPFFLKILVWLSKISKGFGGRMHFPAIGQPIRTLHVKYLACLEGQERALRSLLQQARYLSACRYYHFLSLGLHHKDPLITIGKGIPKITFTSKFMLSSLQNDEQTIHQLLDGIVFEDFSLA